MQEYFADLHVHIGRTSTGHWVKIPSSPQLTIPRILAECAHRKGIHMVGIVDAVCPSVLMDLDALVARGELIPLPGGGLRYQDQVTVLLGAEVEIAQGGGSAHHLCYLPDLIQMRHFSRFLARYVTNPNLSSQRARITGSELLRATLDLGGILIPAHAFTPHKGYFGNCAPRLADGFDGQSREIFAVELGLSADAAMADRMSELARFSFLTNSDAHSVDKIGREHNLLRLAAPTYDELVAALAGRDGRRVMGNYGLDPRLGKYHRTFCPHCRYIVGEPPPVLRCPRCGTLAVVRGVMDRLAQIADLDAAVHPPGRAPYRLQVPLEFVPGIGPRKVERLIERFGSEMAVLHTATGDELAQVVGAQAPLLLAARRGELPIIPGGGGVYGRVTAGGRGVAAS